jgi:hypothetical protein
MWLFINYLSKNLDYFALKYLIVIKESLNKYFKLSRFFLVDYRCEDVEDEVLEALLIKELHFAVVVGKRKGVIVGADVEPVRNANAYHVATISKCIDLVLLNIAVSLLYYLKRQVIPVVNLAAQFDKVVLRHLFFVLRVVEVSI